jgi:ribulose-5-phosphate 4-epimerase/fuculose-1-phosphate aldolase
MSSEKDLREQLALCTRIFAMQGMIGVFGHVSVYQPETKTVFITPGMGSDKGNLGPEQMVPTDLQGKPISGTEGPPVEWPIHTTLHGARADALAGRASAHTACDAVRDCKTRISAGHITGRDLQRRRAALS